MRLLLLSCATLLGWGVCSGSALGAGPRTFVVECRSNVEVRDTSGAVILRSLVTVNQQEFQDGDRVLFERGTVCPGSLKPHGHGFVIAATGEGPLPRIEAGAEDEAALTLWNAEHFVVESLELHGGTTYGVHISGDRAEMRGVSLRNLTVSGVRGALKKKESGLVVVAPAKYGGRFLDVTIDGVRAFDTTQWAGIVVRSATRVTVEHVVVHDVQGDGIVLFDAKDGRIAHSVAWHTGMQAKETIGTPNAIWTWSCERCVVEDNEAFLTDSPGIDGGAFDIDWANSFNSVVRNFGHDTQGYCVSVFAANGPTVHSVVDGNLCLKNGMSPKLAQRQGAILLMSWNGGLLKGVSITNNRVDWRPGGDSPVVQTGETLMAQNISMSGNEFHTTGTLLEPQDLTYAGSNNLYELEDTGTLAEDGTQAQLQVARESGSSVKDNHGADGWNFGAAHAAQWRLNAQICGNSDDERALLLFVNLTTAAAEYSHAGLQLSFEAPQEFATKARDFGLEEAGVNISTKTCATSGASMELISPEGRVAASWKRPVSAIELGLALRKSIGEPEFGRLRFEHVPAKG